MDGWGGVLFSCNNFISPKSQALTQVILLLFFPILRRKFPIKEKKNFEPSNTTAGYWVQVYYLFLLNHFCISIIHFWMSIDEFGIYILGYPANWLAVKDFGYPDMNCGYPKIGIMDYPKINFWIYENRA